MPSSPLRRLRLGGVRALTRDCLCGIYVEIQIFGSRSPDG